MNIKRIWMMAPIIVLLLAMLVPLGTPVSAIQWSGTTDSGNNGTSTGGTFADYKYTTTNILDDAAVGYRFSVVSKSGDEAGQVKAGTSVKDVYMSGERYYSDALKAFRSATPRPKSVIRQDYKDYYNSYTRYSTTKSHVVADSSLSTFPNLPSQPGGGNGQPTIGEWCQANDGDDLDMLLKEAGIYSGGTAGLAKGTDVVLVEPLFFLKIDGKTVVLTATEIALYEYSLYMTSGSGVDIYGKKSGATGTTVGSIIKHSNRDYSQMLREEGTANLSTTDFWYPAANIDSLVGSTFGYGSGTYKITSTYTVPSGTYNILSHIYIITRGYGVGVAWDGSTTPPTNKEAYTLSINCSINDVEESMFPNLTNTSGTVGYASYVQVPEGSGVKTIANAGKDSYGYDAIFEGASREGKFVIKIKQTNGSDVYFYNPDPDMVALCPSNNVMSVSQAHSFSPSYTVRYYTIRFDANAGSGTVSNMPAQNYSFGGKDVWGYIIRDTKNEDITRTATISHPVRSGYTFKGWSTDKNATSGTKGTSSTTLTITNDDATADGDKYNGIVYYAIWEPNPYTVTVNCKINGSSANFPNIKDTSNSTGGFAAYIQHNDSTTKAETKTSFSKDIACGSEYIIKVKDSYQKSRLFYLNSSGGVTSDVTTLTMGSANISYTVNYYTIKFNDNVSDGSVSGMPTASDNTIYGYKLIGSTNKTMSGLSEPTRTGYTFLGWSTNKNATSSANGLQGKNSVEVSDASATADGDATNGIVIYAIWERNNYNITVRSSVNGDGGFANIPDSNTGTGVYSAYIQVGGVTKAHPASDTDDYFTYTMPYGSQYVLKIKDDKNHVVSETTHTVTGDMMHGIDYCTIRFNANAGSDAVSDMPATNYTQSNYGSVYSVYGYKVAESGSKSVSLSTTPKRTGYAFKGWSLTSDGATIGTTSLTLKDADATPNGVEDGIVLYAIWEKFATIQVNCYINNYGADFPDIKHNGIEGFASWLVINNEVAISSGDSAAGDWYAYSTSAGNRYAVCAKVRDDGIPYYLTNRGTWSSNSQNTGTTSTGSLHNYDIDYYTIRFDPNAGSDTVSGMPTQSYSFDGKKVWGYKLVGLNRTVNVGATPERTGYTFKGWSPDGSSAQIVGTNSFTATDSLAEFNGIEDGIVLYAVWEPNTYTVTVDCEINGSPANFPNIPNSTGASGFASYIQDKAQKTTHAKAGTGNNSYSWEGAFDSTYVIKAKDAQTDRVFFVNSSGRIVSDIDVLKVGIVNEYTVGYYTIRFNDNVSDGSVSGMPTASDDVIYGYKLIGPNKNITGLSQPTRTGYTFLGWSTNKNATSSANGLQGKSSVEVSDASAAVDGIEDGIVVYAIWKANGYDITVGCSVNNKGAKFPNITNVAGTEDGFASYIKTGSDVAVKAGASNSVYTVTLPYGTEYTLMAKHEQSVVYYVDSNGNIVTGATTHTLGARDDNYIIKYYTIRFDANAGNDNVSGMPTQSYSFDGTKVWGYKLVGPNRVISGLSQPTRAGYTFLGWSTNKNATEGSSNLQGKTSVNLTDASATADGDATNGIVVYAIWKPNTYTVTVNCKIDGVRSVFPNFKHNGTANHASWLVIGDSIVAKSGTRNSYSYIVAEGSQYTICAKFSDDSSVYYLTSDGTWKVWSSGKYTATASGSQAHTVKYYTINYKAEVPSNCEVIGLPEMHYKLFSVDTLVTSPEPLCRKYPIGIDAYVDYRFLHYSEDEQESLYYPGDEITNDCKHTLVAHWNGINEMSVDLYFEATPEGYGEVYYEVPGEGLKQIRAILSLPHESQLSYRRVLKTSEYGSYYVSYLDITLPDDCGNADYATFLADELVPYRMAVDAGSTITIVGMPSAVSGYLYSAKPSCSWSDAPLGKTLESQLGSDEIAERTVYANFVAEMPHIVIIPLLDGEIMSAETLSEVSKIYRGTDVALEGVQLTGTYPIGTAMLPDVSSDGLLGRVFSGTSKGFVTFEVNTTGNSKYRLIGFFLDADATVPVGSTAVVKTSGTIYVVFERDTDTPIPLYTVTWEDEDGSLLEQDNGVPYGDTPSYDGETPTKDSDDRYDYSFSGWTPEITPVTGDITYTATYTKTPRTYTVTWVDDDGTVLEVDTKVPYGTTPSFDKSTPTKAATAQYTYTFTGWTPAIVPVTKDATYTATYKGTTRTYTVTWKNYNGTVLETDTKVPYGAIPSYDKGSNPTRPSVAQYTYTFIGWTPEIVPVTQDAVYTATFKEVLRTYTVTWLNYDGTVLEVDTEVPYGTMPSYDGETPVKPDDETYTYMFDGWTPTPRAVTKNATYTASYQPYHRVYKVTWVDDDGTVLEKDTYNYGGIPVFNKSTPYKEPTAQYTYTFAGWTPEVVPVTEDAIYTATYTPTLRTYTVTWVDEDGTVLEVDSNVPYGTTPSFDGDTPTKMATQQYTYAFDGWTPEVVPVTKNATYTATYKPSIRKYIIRVRVRVDAGSALPYDGGVYVTINGEKQTLTSPNFGASIEYGASFAVYTTDYEGAPYETYYSGTVTGNKTHYVDYYTLTLTGDDGIAKLETYNVDGNAVILGPILKGTKVSPLATVKPTHIFDEWTYITGTSSPFSAPEGNTSSEPMKLYWPDITVNTITEIMAHSLTHRIVFDKNDPNATGAMDDQYIRPGTGGTLNENEFVNEGRFFIGWNTKPDGSGDYYSDGDYFVAPAGKGGTTTFYAQWGIRVIYNANTGKTSDGGYSIDANGFVRRDGIIVEDIFDTKSSKTIKAYGDFSLYKDGTSCIGWVYDLSDIDGSKVPVAVYTLSDLGSYADESGTVTLYAVWSVRTHKIDFNTNPANDLYGKVVYSNTSVNYITGVPHSSEIAQSGRTITITASQSAVVTVYYTNGTSKSVTLAKGGTLVFTASPNTNTAQYTYGFASWSGAPLVVINDVTATATFTRTLNTFKATFIVEPPDYGSVSKSSVTNIPYGSTVTYKDNTVTITGPSGSGFTKTIVTATPTASTGGTSYSFTGWDGPASVVRNVEIIAFFSQSNKMDIAIVGNDIIGNPKAGSTFTASANLVNLSNQHVGYYDGMLVALDVLDASGNVVAHYEKDAIPVPRLGSNNATTSSVFISTSQDVDRNGTLYTAVKYDNTNFVYFVIDIGLAKGNYKLRWSLDFSNCALEEMGGSNNTDIVNVAVGAKTTASNPNRPDFSTDIPSSFKNKDHGESQTSNSFSWYELDYYQTDTEAFHTKRYTNGLDVVMVFTPENEAGLKDKDINILGLPDYTTRAGYGFSLHAPHSGLGLSINGFSNIKTSMVIGRAYTYGTPEALMTYPEFNYSKDVGKSTTLMVAQSSTGTNYRAFSLAFPEYKDYQSNDVNDRFAHYIPMWFPDGEYTPVTYFSGAWSPLGEMTATVVQGDERVTSGLTGSLNVEASEIMMSRRHIYSTVLKIFGSLYDDIYITG